MELSRELLKQFAQIANGNSNKKQTISSYMNATTVVRDGVKFVQIDGSDQLTPVSETMGIQNGDRVLVTIENHQATVIGNYTYPADARTANQAKTDAEKAIQIANTIIASSITVETLEAAMIEAGYLRVTELLALAADVKTLEADTIKTKDITAEDGKFSYLSANSLNASYATIAQLEAANAKIEEIEAGKITADEIIAAVAHVGYIKATDITASNGSFNYLYSDKLDAKYATIVKLEALEGSFDTLNAIAITTDNLAAKVGEFGYLRADDLEAEIAEIGYLKTDDLEAEIAEIGYLRADEAELIYVKAKELEADLAKLGYLQADEIMADIAEIGYLKAEDADIKYANIDFSNIGEAAIKKFFSDSGIIDNLVFSNGHVTGQLVGVTIKGDLIEGGTVVAEKLVILGEDGLYYKLNTNGVTTSAEQTEYNSLNGKIITAKSITAEKVRVDDLVAFDATIAGLNLTNGSIYSGVKKTVNNTTRGFYVDRDGQLSLGDSSNFIKYYKDQNGNYRLEISADSIVFGNSKETVEEAIKNISVGARNLIRNSSNMIFSNYYFEYNSIVSEKYLVDESGNVLLDENNNSIVE